MSRLIEEYADVALMLTCLALFALSWAATAPAETRPHSHDGGVSWHAHAPGGGR